MKTALYLNQIKGGAKMTLPGVICKCGSEEIFAMQSNQHIKLICAKCGRYIKFANKQEKNLIEAITQRNPFN